MSDTQGAAQQRKFEELLKLQQDKLVLPWLGTTMSIGLCSIVLTIATESNPTEVSSVVTHGLLLLGAALGTAAVLVPRRMISDAKLAAHMRRPLRAEPSEIEDATSEKLPEMKLRLLELVPLFRGPYILSLALSESVALVGLVAGFLHDNVVAAAPYFFAAFVLHGVNYPRLSPLVERARKFEPADEELKAFSRTLDKIHDDFNAEDRRSRKISDQRGPRAGSGQTRTSRTTGERERSPSRPISQRPPPRKP